MFGRRSPSALVAASMVALALTVAGCGVETKDDATSAPDPTTTVDDTATNDTADRTTDDSTSDDTIDDSTSDDTIDDSTSDDTTFDPTDDTIDPLDDDTIRQQIVDLYTGMGLDEDQAGCLADKIMESGDDSSTMDPTAAMDWFADCGISINDLDMGG